MQNILTPASLMYVAFTRDKEHLGEGNGLFFTKPWFYICSAEQLAACPLTEIQLKLNQLFVWNYSQTADKTDQKCQPVLWHRHIDQLVLAE